MTSKEWRELTPEEQRIKVAELCRWRDIVWSEPPRLGSDRSFDVITGLDPERNCYTELPDYINDLNAMHKAVSTMTLTQKQNYCDILKKMTLGPCGTLFWKNAIDLIEATAAQKAEAFVLTMTSGENEK